MIHKYLYLYARQLEVQRFLVRTRRAREIQQQILLRKLARHAQSDFGRRHGFAAIREVAQFRRQVPITDHEYFRPYIERVMAGETSALFGPQTRVLMMAMTSGTTNRAKYLPVTQEFFDQYRRGWNLWGLQTFRDHPDLVRKKTLKLGSNWRQSFTSAGIPCGNISGLVAETAPWIARTRFVLPSAVYALDDPLAKHYLALRIGLACRHVGMIGTANPSTLLEFARLGDARRDALIRDIRDGTLSIELDLESPLRSQLESVLARKLPARARELDRIVERTGHLYPRDAWPGLSVLAVWTGGSVGVYLPRLAEYFGHPDTRDHGLSASEARMTIPLADDTSQGLLEYDHHFFEFVPVEQMGTPDPVVCGAHELEVGQDYFILLTTSGGLYRYDIHDVVRCVGYRGEAPWLVFLNKGAHISSITGEKLSEHQVVAAVSSSLAQLQRCVEHFTLAPVMRDRPGYVLLIEEAEQLADVEKLPPLIDAALQQQNVEYAEKRRSGRLTPIALHSLPAGTWRRFRARRTAARGNFEEFKHPCLIQDLEFVERLLATCSEMTPAADANSFSDADPRETQ